MYACAECGLVTSTAEPTAARDLFLARCRTCGVMRVHREIATRDVSQERDIVAGRAAKERGIALSNGAVPVTWADLFDREVLRLAMSGLTFTSEDVTAAVGLPIRSGAVGARMNAAARRGVIVRTGFRQAERVNQHAALVSEWRGRHAK